MVVWPLDASIVPGEAEAVQWLAQNFSPDCPN